MKIGRSESVLVMVCMITSRALIPKSRSPPGVRVYWKHFADQIGDETILTYMLEHGDMLENVVAPGGSWRSPDDMVRGKQEGCERARETERQR
jgi:hypothetical protein